MTPGGSLSIKRLPSVVHEAISTQAKTNVVAAAEQFTHASNAPA